MKVLKSQNLVSKAGLEAFAKMKPENAKKAAHEQKTVELFPDYKQKFVKNKQSWDYFLSKAPSYQKQCKWWVMSAKQDSTQLKRLNILIDCCENGELIPPMKWSKK